MVSPKGSRIRRFILDEWHEFGLHHPERAATFRKFGIICASLNVQCIFLTASYPEHLHKVFCKMAHISPNIPVIRASTDRPNLGYHFLSVDTSKTSISEATRRLVYACEATLKPDERIIVFYKDHGSADSFAKKNRCAVYHSQLPTNGNNTKGYNLWLWDSGQTKVIAATTALLQGTDRPRIKYVVFCDLPYGEISYHQGGGRGGRAGEPAYVFVLFAQKTVFIRGYGKSSSKDVQVRHSDCN
jgi:superfamily II DNA helicase RecQ